MSINLPRLPQSPPEWWQQQQYWQQVVEAIEASLDAQEATIAQLVATQEDVSSLLATSAVAVDSARRALALAQSLSQNVEVTAAITEARINSVSARGEAIARELENAEILWLH